MAMPQRDDTIEAIKRLDALLEYAVMHDDEVEAERIREEIEKFVGSKVEWNMAKMDGAFSVVKEFDINASQSEWPMAFKWLCETAIRFKRVDEKFGGQ